MDARHWTTEELIDERDQLKAEVGRLDDELAGMQAIKESYRKSLDEMAERFIKKRAAVAELVEFTGAVCDYLSEDYSVTATGFCLDWEKLKTKYGGARP